MLSQKLKELRLNKGITQTEFAETFNIANGTVGNWETGKREPDYEMLSRIADFYGVTVDYLLGRDQKAKPAENDRLEENTILLAMRDGGVKKRKLTSEQMELIEKMIEQMPQADDDL